MHRQAVYLLVLSAVMLIALGMVMLFSSSAFSPDAHGETDYFLKKQGLWLGIGAVVCLVSARLNYHFWQKTWWVWFVIAMTMLTLCFIPGVRHKINGSYRWITFHGVNFQPSELGKFAAICALAAWFGREKRVEREFWQGFVYPCIPVGCLLALIAPEVDMGSTALIGTTSYVIMFVAGTRLRYLLPVALAGVALAGFAISKMPERVGRIMAFMHPELYPKDAYQAQQGLIAFGSGGVEGLGLGNGRQKLSYLPEAYSDFILPTVAEELGLRCTLGIVFTYVLFLVCGALISLRARDRFGLLLGIGFVVIISLQAAVNIGVTTSLLPNKGLPLPFISYGGSNLVFCLLGVGILINIYRHGKGDREARASTPLEVRATKPRRMLVRL